MTPTISLGKWFQQRADKMLVGGASNTDPLLTFDLSGPANGGKRATTVGTSRTCSAAFLRLLTTVQRRLVEEL